MAPEELRERDAGELRLAVVERDVEGGEALHRNALPTDRRRGPEQLFPDPARVEGVLAHQERRDLFRVREQRGPARPLAVAEAEALETIGRRDMRDDDVDVAERALAAGRDLRIAHRLFERDPIERATHPRHSGGGAGRDGHGRKVYARKPTELVLE